MIYTFIGMPGSGKTTIGKKFAQIMNYSFLDTDNLIEEKLNTSIQDYFAKEGEEQFRVLETKVIEETLQSTENLILSVGGGAILKNGELIKKFSTVIYLDRSIDDIWNTMNNKRPLVKSRLALEEIYNKRADLYKKYSDIQIKHTSIDSTLNEIEKYFNTLA